MNDILKEKIKNIKLIAADMDGTLLGANGKISEHTAEVIREAARQGFYFTFATGRQAGDMWKFRETVPVNAPVICSNGGEIADTKNGKIYRRDTIEYGEVERLAEYFLSENLDFICRTPKAEYANPGCRYLENMYRKKENAIAHGVKPYGIEILDPKSLSLPYDGEYIKLMVWTDTEEEREKAEKFISVKNYAVMQPSSPIISEIVPYGTDKGRGLSEVCRILGINEQQCCVFGDFDNDLPMMRKAGIAVAMGNAIEAVKREADYVTLRNTEDGVAYGITELLLNE